MENDSLTNISVKLIILIINLTDIFDISNKKKTQQLNLKEFLKKKRINFFHFTTSYISYSL